MRFLAPAFLLALLLVWGCTQSPTPTPGPAGGGDAVAADAPETDDEGEGRGAGRGRGGRGGGARQSSEPRPYDEVVTSEAETRTGMFTTHMIGDQLLFEIP